MRRRWGRGVFQYGDKRVLGVDLRAGSGKFEEVVKTLGVGGGEGKQAQIETRGSDWI